MAGSSISAVGLPAAVLHRLSDGPLATDEAMKQGSGRISLAWEVESDGKVKGCRDFLDTTSFLITMTETT